MLRASVSMDNIADDARMLEPADLGKLVQLSGAEVNQLLARHGVQVRGQGRWVPTEAANGSWATHAWQKHGKSGYNLKWNVAFVQGLVNTEAVRRRGGEPC